MLMDTQTQVRNFTVQVRQRGQVTIPQRLRADLAIEEGDTLVMIQIGDSIVLSPKTLKGPELTDKFSALMEEYGITLADLLEDLPKIREEIFYERYGNSPS